MKSHLLFSLTFQPSNVVWAEKPWRGGTQAPVPCPSSFSGAKLPFQQGRAPGSRRHRLFSGCSGAAAHMIPTDLSHANDNPSVYMKM